MKTAIADALLYVWSKFMEPADTPESGTGRCNPHHVDWMFGRCAVCHDDVRDIAARGEKYDHRI